MEVGGAATCRFVPVRTCDRDCSDGLVTGGDAVAWIYSGRALTTGIGGRTGTPRSGHTGFGLTEDMSLLRHVLVWTVARKHSGADQLAASMREGARLMYVCNGTDKEK